MGRCVNHGGRQRGLHNFQGLVQNENADPCYKTIKNFETLRTGTFCTWTFCHCRSHMPMKPGLARENRLGRKVVRADCRARKAKFRILSLLICFYITLAAGYRCVWREDR